MIAAVEPIQRSADVRLLVVDAAGRITHAPRSQFVEFLRPGDLVIANDAATLPASLRGVHAPTGADIEVRLAGWPPLGRSQREPSQLEPSQPVRFGESRRSSGGQTASKADSTRSENRHLETDDVRLFSAIVFGAGDFHTRTEDRPEPPTLAIGDRLLLGPLSATVQSLLGHPRLVMLRFDGSAAAIWEGLAQHGRPIQYAHVRSPLALWDVWTPIAGPPVAFEPPSAGFAIDWQAISAMRDRGIRFATLTHAAGISSTGDASLDRRLPFDEPYRIPHATAFAIGRAKAEGARIVAIGTTVVRALEHAANRDGIVRAGDGVATGTIGPSSRLRVVDVILSGTHEADSPHYQMLRAFLDDTTLARVSTELETRRYRTHEFGDSVLIEKPSRADGLGSEANDRAA
jgi:S-adenosylmethionine:tRNA ribosyltransferase-isomerase